MVVSFSFLIDAPGAAPLKTRNRGARGGVAVQQISRYRHKLCPHRTSSTACGTERDRKRLPSIHVKVNRLIVTAGCLGVIERRKKQAETFAVAIYDNLCEFRQWCSESPTSADMFDDETMIGRNRPEAKNSAAIETGFLDLVRDPPRIVDSAGQGWIRRRIGHINQRGYSGMNPSGAQTSSQALPPRPQHQYSSRNSSKISCVSLSSIVFC
jgi:hypothetical protein